MKTIWYAIKTHTQQWCSGIAPCSLLDKKVRPVCFTRFYQWDLVCILFSFILGPLVHRMIWAASIKKKLKQRSQPGTNFIKIHHLASRTEQKMHLLYSLLGKKTLEAICRTRDCRVKFLISQTSGPSTVTKFSSFLEDQGWTQLEVESVLQGFGLCESICVVPNVHATQTFGQWTPTNRISKYFGCNRPSDFIAITWVHVATWDFFQQADMK